MRSVVVWSVIVSGAVEAVSWMLGLELVEKASSFVLLTLLWGVMLHFSGAFEAIGSFVEWFTNRVNGATARIESATEQLNRQRADEESLATTTIDIDGVSEKLREQILEAVKKNVAEINRKVEWMVAESRRKEATRNADSAA